MSKQLPDVAVLRVRMPSGSWIPRDVSSDKAMLDKQADGCDYLAVDHYIPAARHKAIVAPLVEALEKINDEADMESPINPDPREAETIAELVARISAQALKAYHESEVK